MIINVNITNTNINTSDVLQVAFDYKGRDLSFGKPYSNHWNANLLSNQDH